MLVGLGFFWFTDSRLTVGQPVFIEESASTSIQVDVCRLIVQESVLNLAS